MRRACVVTLVGKYDSIEIIGDNNVADLFSPSVLLPMEPWIVEERKRCLASNFPFSQSNLTLFSWRFLTAPRLAGFILFLPIIYLRENKLLPCIVCLFYRKTSRG